MFDKLKQAASDAKESFSKPKPSPTQPTARAPKIVIEGIEAPIKSQAHVTMSSNSSLVANGTQVPVSQPNKLYGEQVAQSGEVSVDLPPDKEGDIRAKKLSAVLSEMSKLPMWVQQVIYTDLKEHLEKNVTMRTLGSMARENFLQLWSPTLTTKGSMAQRNSQMVDNQKLYMALQSIHKFDNVAMMCARYQWSLQDACHALIESIKQDYITPPSSTILDASLHFLGDKIRIGEYLQLIGCVEPEQLEQALQTQEYIKNAMGESARIADILVRLELVTNEDVESILFLKEESTKPFRLF